MESLADTKPNAFVRRHADAYLKHVGSARRAYEAHEGRKVVVRYEDLRADTLGTIKRMYGELNGTVELTRKNAQCKLERIFQADANGESADPGAASMIAASR